MKVLAVTLLALVAVTNARNINIGDVMNLENNSAYNYHNKVGIPLAEAIRKAEAESPSRIVGGDPALLGEIPFQAGLLIQLAAGTGVCGGSLLNTRKVLTAAHCWFDGVHQGLVITVILGSVTLYSGGQRFVTTDIHLHENWNWRVARNDVAMITLPTNVNPSNVIAPIALPSGAQLSENFAGETAVASGFGLMFDGGAVSPNLNRVGLTVITNAECIVTYPLFIQATNVCVDTANGRNICNGDSGGPLTVVRNNNRILIGVSSFGHGEGCQAHRPSAFARVTMFDAWIRNLM